MASPFLKHCSGKMSELLLAGKDYFTEEEAAAYCCVSADKFFVVAGAYGLTGPKYSREDLRGAIEEAFANPAAHRQRIADFLPRDYGIAKAIRTPAWADRKAIAAVYKAARQLTKATGIKYAVDHIIPLRGSKVSGLHVHNNLQVITASANSAKHNKYQP